MPATSPPLPPSLTSAAPGRQAAGRRRAAGWVPDQHGAWAMLVLPFVAGFVLAEPRWTHLALFALWIVGYLAFFAAGRWLRSRRRRRDLPPMLVYGAACVPLGLVVLALDAALVRWVPLFVPLLALSVWLTVQRRDRSLTNDATVVVAACLMAPVAFAAGEGTAWPSLWVVFGVLVAYFLGTVLYVKTMIRERGRRGYVVASLGFHLVGSVGAAGLALTGRASWWLPVVWLALAGRALAGPVITARRPRPLRPAVIGVGEIVASLLLTTVTLAGVS
jgi:hypothetical protein